MKGSSQFRFGLDHTLYLFVSAYRLIILLQSKLLKYYHEIRDFALQLLMWFSLLKNSAQILKCTVSPWIALFAFHTSNSFHFSQNSSDLPGLIQIMIMTFSEMPPVYSKPKTAQPPGATPYPLPYPTNSPG